MDITPQNTTQQPISDDQELAKALAGVLDEPIETEEPAVAAASVSPSATDASEPELSFEETPAPAGPTDPVASAMPAPTTPISPVATPVAPPTPPSQDSGDLAELKKTALNELRPLMDKVELPADEKFNTYLMLLRSTDDASLVGPAHQAALAISDEKARATALLEIIKEIDYLSSPDKTAA